jgi:biopolymer transport protein ExbD
VLQKRQRSSPVSLFVLEADEQARHGKVVELMDAARQVGIPRLAIATRSEDEEEKRK